jgi:hypothetical protein
MRDHLREIIPITHGKTRDLASELAFEAMYNYEQLHHSKWKTWQTLMAISPARNKQGMIPFQ